MAVLGRDAPLEKFKLYKNLWKFYLVGRDKGRMTWRVLKINRSNPDKLDIQEDLTVRTKSEWQGFKKKLETNSAELGPLKFVIKCYGVVGFVKFLGPYYMMLITGRNDVGTILDHTIYAVSKIDMLPIYNLEDEKRFTSMLENSTDAVSKTDMHQIYNLKGEDRYKKLLCSVDLTKGDFFFGYSYNIMNSLQMNLSDGETGDVLYESMFVWNAYLTLAIRDQLKTTSWTVALINGFFEQKKFSVHGKGFIFTLISRRSRHFVGPRYIKRGINNKGKVANDVETEQIVFEDTDETVPTRIASVVQRRGSIPIFWSQKNFGLNVRPDMKLLKEDDDYKATKLHFDDLARRYGNPIVLLSLIRSHEKKVRESALHAEYINAVNHIKRDLLWENTLIFLHLDMHTESRRKNANVMMSLHNEAKKAFESTGILYCQVSPALRNLAALNFPIFRKNDSEEWLYINQESIDDHAVPMNRLPMLQRGVLRTNCIDSLDRTNVAQYVYSLIALGHQLYALGLLDVQEIGLDDGLAKDLMVIYERMGNKLALQYAGSPAHNQIFSNKRGQWNLATQFEELKTTFQRYVSGVFTDEEKQDAFDIFLGHFQPAKGKPALWELKSNEREIVRLNSSKHYEESKRTFLNRSYSDSHIMFEEKDLVSESETLTTNYGDTLYFSVYDNEINTVLRKAGIPASLGNQKDPLYTSKGNEKNNFWSEGNNRPIEWGGLLNPLPWLATKSMQCISFVSLLCQRESQEP